MFWGLFKKNTKHILDDDDREKAAELNRLRWAKRRENLELQASIEALKLKKQQLALEMDIKEMSGDEGEGNDDDAVFMSLLSGVFNRGGNGESSPVALPPNVEKIHLSDDEITNLLKTVPKPALKAAKMMSRESIASFIRQKIGDLDDDTMNRALGRLGK